MARFISAEPQHWIPTAWCQMGCEKAEARDESQNSRWPIHHQQASVVTGDAFPRVHMYTFGRCLRYRAGIGEMNGATTARPHRPWDGGVAGTIMIALLREGGTISVDPCATTSLCIVVERVYSNQQSLSILEDDRLPSPRLARQRLQARQTPSEVIMCSHASYSQHPAPTM